MTTVYSVTVRVAETTKTIFSEESYQDVWNQLYKWVALNYPGKHIHHIHSSESNY